MVLGFIAVALAMLSVFGFGLVCKEFYFTKRGYVDYWNVLIGFSLGSLSLYMACIC